MINTIFYNSCRNSRALIGYRKLPKVTTRAQPLFCSLNLLFRDVAVAVVVFFSLNSLRPITAHNGYRLARHYTSVTINTHQLS